MKTRRPFRKIISLLSLTLAAVMLLTSMAFAANDTETPEPFTFLRGGAVQLADYDEIRTDWNNDGCQLDTCFGTGESLLRRLRLTFDTAYNLYDVYQATVEATTAEAVLYADYQRYGYGTLRSYLSNRTLNYYYDADGAVLLRNLRSSSEYRNNAVVRWLVDTELAKLESYNAPQLRLSLSYFCSETILQNMDFAQLKAMAASVIATPEYIQLRNTLYGHDCSTVETLMRYGYSLDYISRLYSSRAEAAVKAIWPDYVDRMNDYWRANRAW